MRQRFPRLVSLRGSHARPRRGRRRRPAAVLLTVSALGLALLAACGTDDRRAGDEDAPAAEVEAVGPWVRVAIVPEATGDDAPPVNSAGYLVLRNHTAEDDALIAVETTIADTAEIHSVSMADGVMRMRPVEEVAVPADGEAVLEPGGFHIMLIGIHGALAEGDTVDLALRLRSGRTLDVAAPVRRAPPE